MELAGAKKARSDFFSSLLERSLEAEGAEERPSLRDVDGVEVAREDGIGLEGQRPGGVDVRVQARAQAKARRQRVEGTEFAVTGGVGGDAAPCAGRVGDLL